MKRILLAVSAVALMAMVSCNKSQDVPSGEGRPVLVTVSISGEHTGTTKATGVTYSNEEKVNNVQLYIFNNGDLENYTSVDNAKTIEIAATSGTRTIWALVNAPALSDIKTESALRSRTSSLEDNAIDGLVMVGYATQDLSDGANVPIVVKRMVSRVSLLRITPQFTFSKENYVMEIQGIYLINVVGSSLYDGSFIDAGVWYNKLGLGDGSASECPAMLYDASSATIQNGVPHEVEHVFYPYPNPVESTGNYSATWSPRHTMLVVQVRVVTSGASGTLPVGTVGYYPVELPTLERNKSYVIENIILTKNPGSTPYEPLDDDAVSAVITVDGWAGPVNLGTQYL